MPFVEAATGIRSRSSRRVGSTDKITARSMTFCSSRMFPGHG